MTEKHRIDIEVVTRYLEEQSLPTDDRYVFAYTITIRNAGSATTRLLRRHWVITDARGGVQEVEGDGVVGEQPYLRPGESFQYTSGVILATPSGSMEGEYWMVDSDSEEFQTTIPAFTLSLPHTLH